MRNRTTILILGTAQFVMVLDSTLGKAQGFLDRPCDLLTGLTTGFHERAR